MGLIPTSRDSFSVKEMEGLNHVFESVDQLMACSPFLMTDHNLSNENYALRFDLSAFMWK